MSETARASVIRPAFRAERRCEQPCGQRPGDSRMRREPVPVSPSRQERRRSGATDACATGGSPPRVNARRRQKYAKLSFAGARFLRETIVEPEAQVRQPKPAPLAQSAERLHGKNPARNGVLTCEDADENLALCSELDALN
jgi:hypothetical protein